VTGPSTSGRWARVDDLFHRAIDLPEANRAPFLAAECGDDAALLADVSSLVAAHAQAGDFIERPAVDRRSIDHESPTLAGRTLGPYTGLRQIGRGGMGIVYLARDTRLDRVVALKALAPRFTRDPRQRERLRREARLAAGLSHPGIATIYALEEFDDQILIVSEYLDGCTLREEIADGPLSPERAVATALEVAEALAAAHARGVLHRDLKPENVMRTHEGHIKILDFGLARFADAAPDAALAPRLTETGALLGTPAYMAPEQLRGQTVDARADLFAWGVLAYELASGRHPFAAAGTDASAVIVNVLEHEPRALADLQPALPMTFVDVVTRCLAKEGAARPASAAAIAEAIACMPHGPIDRAPRRSAATGRAPAVTMLDAPPLPLWWWRFHQLMASLVYCVMVVPLWLTRPWMPARWGSTVFALALAAVLAATTLRLHLWFTSMVYPHEWAAQREHTSGWLRLADLSFVALLGMAGVALLGEHDGTASIFVAVGVAALLASTIIEPATTRAAFKH
jgi:hypothetical protein